MAGEARVMAYARAEGFPVPEVREISADGTELVMERIGGPTMVEAIKTKPWTLRRSGVVLGSLHHRLHQIPGPAWLRPSPTGRGDALVHLDLHPQNIINGPGGPVVIDWANAAAGVGEVDAALTWVLLASGDVPAGRLWTAVMAAARRRVIAGFLSAIEVERVRPTLRQAVTWKVTDEHMSAAEQARMWALVAEAEAPPTRPDRSGTP